MSSRRQATRQEPSPAPSLGEGGEATRRRIFSENCMRTHVWMHKCVLTSTLTSDKSTGYATQYSVRMCMRVCRGEVLTVLRESVNHNNYHESAAREFKPKPKIPRRQRNRRLRIKRLEFHGSKC
eukprot:1533811-Pyramimonas_sp.AAC.1